MNRALLAEIQRHSGYPCITIETVLRMGGGAVIVPEGERTEHDRLAAVLRY